MKQTVLHLGLALLFIAGAAACARTVEVSSKTGGQGDARAYTQAELKDFFLNLVNIVKEDRDTPRPEAMLEIRLQAKATNTYPARREAEAKIKELGPDKYEVFSYKERDKENGWVVLEKSAVITGLDMRNAIARPSSFAGGNYEIGFTLTPEGGKRFGEVTGAHIGDNLAIVLNNEVRSIATIQARIEDQGRITGTFNQSEAEKIALSLNSDAPPAKRDQWAEQLSERLKSNGPEFLDNHYRGWAVELYPYSDLTPEEIEAALEPGDGNWKTLHIKLLKSGKAKGFYIRVITEGGRLRVDDEEFQPRDFPQNQGKRSDT